MNRLKSVVLLATDSAGPVGQSSADAAVSWWRSSLQVLRI